MKKIWFALAITLMAAGAFAGSMEMTSARLYKKQGEWAKALQFYDTELQKNPTNPDAYFERGEMLGEIAMDAGKLDLARQIAGDAINPQRALLERMLADFDNAKKNADEKSSKKIAKEIDKITNEHWNTFYVNGVHADSTREYDKAIEQAGLANLLLPHDWRAFGLKAQVLDRMALTATEKADSVQSAIERDSLRNVAVQKSAESLECWESAYKYLGESNWAKEKPEQYKQAMEIITGRLVEGYYNLGQYQKTISLAGEILKTDPSNGNAIQFRGFAFAQMASDTSYSQKQRDSLRAVAVSALNEARKDRPDYSPIVFSIGQFNLQLGDTAAALAAFDDFLKMEPEDRDARFIIGVVYLEGGSFVNTQKARDTFKTLTEHHPDDAAAWINYGVSLIRLGDNDNGKKAIAKGKELSGK